MKHNAPTTDVTHTDLAHESAVKHVTGRANYTDDIAEPAGTLHAYLGLSDIAHGEISALDLDNVLSDAGVVGVRVLTCTRIHRREREMILVPVPSGSPICTGMVCVHTFCAWVCAGMCACVHLVASIIFVSFSSRFMRLASLSDISRALLSFSSRSIW